MKLGNRKLKGFTLVELLMVLGIIALLTSIMMPTLHKVRERANNAVCLNNLRCLSQGAILYCADFDGFFPNSHPTYSSTHNNCWYLCLAGWDAGSHVVGPTYVEHKGWAKKEQPYFCPSNQADYSGGSHGWTNYAGNYNLIGERIFSVKTTEKVLYLGSYTPGGGTWFSNAGARWFNPWASTYAVHDEQVNVSFVDGSAKGVNVTPHHSINIDLGDLKAEWFWPVN